MTQENPDSLMDRARALLGQEVEVTIGTDVLCHGQLMMFGDDGEFVVKDEMGFTHWCWPMLDIKAVDR